MQIQRTGLAQISAVAAILFFGLGICCGWLAFNAQSTIPTLAFLFDASPALVISLSMGAFLLWALHKSGVKGMSFYGSLLVIGFATLYMFAMVFIIPHLSDKWTFD